MLELRLEYHGIAAEDPLMALDLALPLQLELFITRLSVSEQVFRFDIMLSIYRTPVVAAS